MRDLPLIEVAGTPREQGLWHGAAAEKAVAENVRTYLERFAAVGKVSRAEVHRRASAYRRVIEKASPDYAAAMDGIAEGSGQEILDVVALNVRYEILYSEFAHRGMERALAGPSAVGGCTSFALLPSLTANGHLLIGQNWDWIPEVRGLVVRRRDGVSPDQLAFTEAGIAGAKIGLNAAGVGLAINGLVSNLDSWSRLRKPFHVRCWEILAARTLPEAELAITSAKRSCSTNFVLAQAGEGGGVVDLEAAPENECRLEPANGFLAHTNHFSDPDALGIWQPLAEDKPSTFDRHRRIQEVLQGWAAKGRKVAVEDLKRLLRDHENAPRSLCRHQDLSLAPELRYETVVSVVMDLDAREMYVASGTPCTARYRKLSLAADPKRA